MFKEVEDALISVLQENNINAQAWNGSKEELFRLPRRLPAVRLVLEKATFTPKNAFAFDVVLNYSFLVFFRSLKDNTSGAFSIIENILDLLTSKTDYNFSPLELTLLYHENGEFCYKLDGKCEYLFILPSSEEVLVKRITTYEGESLISDVKTPDYQEGG